MSGQTDNQLATIGTVTGLAATSAAYAMFLNSPVGRRWDARHTWFMTVIGVGFTLAWLAATDKRAAIKALAHFAVAGAPIAVRALYNNLAEMEGIANRDGRD